MNKEKTIVAAFDFDGTITYWDTFIPFLLYIAGKKKFTIKLIRLIPKYLSYKFGKIANDKLKEVFMETFLKGYKYRDLQSIGKNYAASVLPVFARKKMTDKIHMHKEQGHKCVLVSASLDVYLEPWAHSYGMEVISTKLEVDSQGIITGKIMGRNCYGAEKEKCLNEWLGNQKPDYLYAYGDSRGDLEMLQMADVKYFRGQIINNN